MHLREEHAVMHFAANANGLVVISTRDSSSLLHIYAVDKQWLDDVFDGTEMYGVVDARGAFIRTQVGEKRTLSGGN